ncbi:hypothetical protein TNCV_4166161 [Trichonephila clavipes]|nr:hypothetical protein TNCV_4166161 [Trichonephila clavipes]
MQTPSQAQAILNKCLPDVTLARYMKDLAKINIFKSKYENFEFSVAINESTDTLDTAQVAIFIHDVEELTSIVAPKGTARGPNLYSNLTQTLDKCELDFSNISYIHKWC